MLSRASPSGSAAKRRGNATPNLDPCNNFLGCPPNLEYQFLQQLILSVSVFKKATPRLTLPPLVVKMLNDTGTLM